MKKIIFILALLCSFTLTANASCLLAEAQTRVGRLDRAKKSYEGCALQDNDAESQYKLGTFYRDGTEPVKQSMKMALFYLRLSAENGYAPAQSALAALMETLVDFGTKGTEALTDYQEQMSEMGFEKSKSLSAFAWVLLAAEKTDNKWFYPSPALSDEGAANLVKKWTASKGQAAKKEALQQAALWKENRLIKSAAQLLSMEEYAAFMQKMYPKTNDAQTLAAKKQAMSNLKQVWENRKNK